MIKRKTGLVGIIKKIGKQFNLLSEDTTNSGGCGVFACLVGHHLQQMEVNLRLHASGLYCKSADIRLLSYLDKYAADGLGALNATGVYLSHVFMTMLVSSPRAVSPRVVRFDSDGVVSLADPIDLCCPSGYTMYADSFCVNDILPFVKKQTGWNSTFDRSNIPMYASLVNDTFSEFGTKPIDVTDWEI